MNSTATDTNLPPLQPLLADWVLELVAQSEQLSDALARWGSPLHVHDPHQLTENAATFHSAFADAGVSGLVCYARKANRCRAVVAQAIKDGEWIDVASLDEARETLALGAQPSQVICTAATKSSQLLSFCAEHGVMLVLDNFDELEALRELVAGRTTPLPVAVRLSCFPGLGKNAQSRFGFPLAQLPQAMESLAPLQGTALSVVGFQFHLDGYEISERARALDTALDLVEHYRPRGFPLNYIDIGGGMTVCYLKDKGQWESFLEQLRDAVAGLRSPITFGNDGLGYSLVQGRVEGAPKLYPFWNAAPKGEFLRGVLASESARGGTLASRIRAHNLTIMVEPGRALLDQVGVTAAAVSHVKAGANGEAFVVLEMNATQIRSVSLDMCLDPIHIPSAANTRPATPCSVFLCGNSCMESDVILKRQISLQRMPQRGDLFVFANTAGYHMHLFENSGHSFSLPRNVVRTPAGRLVLDSVPE